MAWIDFDKLDKAIEKLRMFARATVDAQYRNFLARVPSRHGRRKVRLSEEQLEQEYQSIEQKIRKYEGAGLIKLPCVACGQPFEVDSRSLAFLARLYGGVDPDTFAICPTCRSTNKKAVSRMKRAVKRRSVLL